MFRKLQISILGIIVLASMSGCSKDYNDYTNHEKEQEVVIHTDDDLAVNDQGQIGENHDEEPPKLNMAKYDSLPEAAKQIGFSFHALKDFESVDYHFSKIKIVNDVMNVQDMEVNEPNNMIVIRYEDSSHMHYIEVTAFPYTGDLLQSVSSAPICYVSTEPINGIDVDLSEYILRLVPVDYEMTEEDKQLDPGKIGFSTDGVATQIQDLFLRKMYWVQDNVYYEIAVGESNVSVETMKALVEEYMLSELFQN